MWEQSTSYHGQYYCIKPTMSTVSEFPKSDLPMSYENILKTNIPLFLCININHRRVKLVAG